jgi:hypothetical protein
MRPRLRTARARKTVAPKFDQVRLLRVEFQPELPQPFPQLLQEPLGFPPVLKPQHGVISVADNDYIGTSQKAGTVK